MLLLAAESEMAQVRRQQSLRQAEPRISQVNIRAFRRARLFGLRPANIVATIALG